MLNVSSLILVGGGSDWDCAVFVITSMFLIGEISRARPIHLFVDVIG